MTAQIDNYKQAQLNAKLREIQQQYLGENSSIISTEA
jgi:hypothetical protein